MKSNKKRAKAGRPVNKDSDETRRAILNAARSCFATAGYRATSNRSIAERAGVTAGSIYHYFDSKSELFLAVHHEIQESLLGAAREVLNEARSMTAGWAALYETMFAIHNENADVSRFNAVLRIEAQRNPEIAGALYDQEWRKLYQDLAKLAIQSGEIDPANERELRAVLAAAALGLTQHMMEASIEDHKLCMQGFVELFNGNLVGPYRQPS